MLRCSSNTSMFSVRCGAWGPVAPPPSVRAHRCLAWAASQDVDPCPARHLTTRVPNLDAMAPNLTVNLPNFPAIFPGRTSPPPLAPLP